MERTISARGGRGVRAGGVTNSGGIQTAHRPPSLLLLYRVFLNRSSPLRSPPPCSKARESPLLFLTPPPAGWRWCVPPCQGALRGGGGRGPCCQRRRRHVGGLCGPPAAGQGRDHAGRHTEGGRGGMGLTAGLWGRAAGPAWAGGGWVQPAGGCGGLGPAARGGCAAEGGSGPANGRLGASCN